MVEKPIPATIPVEPTLLPAVVADPGEIARIADTIDISDRAAISVYGDRAQQSVTDYADKILGQVRNRISATPASS